eukprot:scaffold292700_cov30-Tisochrysis_lutea.AAC.7
METSKEERIIRSSCRSRGNATGRGSHSSQLSHPAGERGRAIRLTWRRRNRIYLAGLARSGAVGRCANWSRHRRCSLDC